jgi:hypothetical protein
LGVGNNQGVVGEVAARSTSSQGFNSRRWVCGHEAAELGLTLGITVPIRQGEEPNQPFFSSPPSYRKFTPDPAISAAKDYSLRRRRAS